MATYQLRALSFGEVLDGAFAVYRRHFGTLVGVAAVCMGIPTILNMYVTAAGVQAISIGITLIWMLSYGLGGLLAAGGTIRVISRAYLGHEPTLGDALRFALGKMGKIFLAGLAKVLVIALVWVGAVILGGLATALFSGIVPALLGFATILGAVVATIVLYVGYAVVTQAAVLEQETSAVDSLRRSWNLTDGFKWKAFGLGVVLWVLLSVPFIAAGVLAALVPALEVAISGAAGLLQLVVYPVFAAGFTLLYYDLRVRKEAFDVEYLGRQLGFDTSLA